MPLSTCTILDLPVHCFPVCFLLDYHTFIRLCFLLISAVLSAYLLKFSLTKIAIVCPTWCLIKNSSSTSQINLNHQRKHNFHTAINLYRKMFSRSFVGLIVENNFHSAEWVSKNYQQKLYLLSLRLGLQFWNV